MLQAKKAQELSTQRKDTFALLNLKSGHKYKSAVSQVCNKKEVTSPILMFRIKYSRPTLDVLKGVNELSCSRGMH